MKEQRSLVDALLQSFDLRINVLIRELVVRSESPHVRRTGCFSYNSVSGKFFTGVAKEEDRGLWALSLLRNLPRVKYA